MTRSLSSCKPDNTLAAPFREREREREIIIKLNAFRYAVDFLLVCDTHIKKYTIHLILLDILVGKLKLYFVMTLL